MRPTDGPVDQIQPCLTRMSKTSGIPVGDIALISPDNGAAMRYDLSKYGVLTFTGGKKRDPRTGALSGFEMSLNSIDETAAFLALKAALIVDDICDGGGTFIGLAEEIRKLNPDIKLGLYVSHGIFSKGLEVLDQHFDWVFASDYTFHNENTKVMLTKFNQAGVCIR
jgi:ribose-phosphate pyrophosphokinase